MGQIRFQVGAPRAGSAAKSAEEEPRARSVSSLAGTAARAAEEAKRTAGSPGVQGAPTIRMRAAGGTISRSSAGNEVVVVASKEVLAVPQAVLPVSQVSAMTQADASSQPGALQTAVSRVHSLVRSLFRGRPRTP